MSNKHYINEIGTRIAVKTTGLAIRDYDPVSLRVKKPDGTMCEWSATLVSGVYIQHTVIDGDFDQPGKYSVQPYVATSGWSGVGETSTFDIYRYYC